ncbi:MAG: pyrimidine-nucleoside phosphorylase [Bacillota bacterium]
MRAYDIIAKKRDGFPLTDPEIKFLIRGFVEGTIPDYQIAAWAMAVFFQGMGNEEISSLTREMIDSGDTINLEEITGIKVDKHSTGGVGDKTSLIVGPIVAAGGIPVAKMSGRGLGHTGGTIDKLESIPGFNVELAREQFISQVNKIGLALVSQTGNLVPADKQLYALRDVTATVNSIPLIASSIMSKKIASGADAILLDVKTGNGAFIKSLGEAEKLAQIMVEIGVSFNKDTMAVISNMDQPLGYAVGNSIEVMEAITTLKGQGPEDLTHLSLTLAAYMFILSKKAVSYEQGYEIAKKILLSGKGLAKLGEFIAAQGGDANVIDNFTLFPLGKGKFEVKSAMGGFVEAINTELIGKSAMITGAGRSKQGENIDLGVGVYIFRKIGDKVSQDEVLAEIVYNDEQKAQEAADLILKSYKITSETVARPEVVYKTIHSK